MTEKYYIQAQGFLEDSFRLARKILDSGFRPSFIVALWRGGTPVGIAVQELLAYHGVETDHIAIRTSSYSGIDGRSREIRIHGLSYLIKNVTHEDRLLFVDDVFDTGHTLDAVIKDVRRKSRLNTPEDIRIAVPYYKPERRKVELEPDYYLHSTEQWLKYPHSLEGLSIDEVRQHRPELYEVMRNYLHPSGSS